MPYWKTPFVGMSGRLLLITIKALYRGRFINRFYAEPTVSEAENTTLGRTVALKFPRAKSRTTKQALEGFLREARAAAALGSARPYLRRMRHGIGAEPKGDLFSFGGSRRLRDVRHNRIRQDQAFGFASTNRLRASSSNLASVHTS